jgi:exosortase
MLKTRHSFFLAIAAVLLGVFWAPLWNLARFSLQRDDYSHSLLIPLISVFLIYWRKTDVFARPTSTCYAGLIAILAGLALYGVARSGAAMSSQEVGSSLSLSILGLVISCLGAFLFTYGWPVFRAALFPLGFLLFMVPLPSVLLGKVIYGLQEGSSEAVAILMRGVGVPFLRDGFVFRLPGVSIEVAKECSGIRSSIALLITTLLAAQFLLRSNWRKLALCLLVFPVALLKNGLRITTLSILAVYVNHDILFGWLHRSGGFVFYLLGLTVLWGALRLLQIGDAPGGRYSRSYQSAGEHS